MKQKIGKAWIFLRDVSGILLPYWRSGESRLAGAMVAGVLGLVVGRIYLDVQITNWWKGFFDAIQSLDYAGYVHQLLRYALLSLLVFPLQGCIIYLQGLLKIRWRRWLSERYVGQWLNEVNYYRVQYVDGTDNPDQRIAEDLRILAERTVELVLDFVSTLGSLAAFSVVLWNSQWVFAVGEVRIPGAMLWLAAFYSLAGTWVNHTMGKALAALTWEKQKWEANYRFALMRLRENAELVAVYGGEVREKYGLTGRLAQIVATQLQIIHRNKRLDWFFRGYFQLSQVLPYLPLAPLYIAGSISLGDMQQAASAFARLRMSFSWFIMNYEKLAEWKATADRVIGLEKAMIQTAALQVGGVIRATGPYREGLRVAQLDLWLPDGKPLLKGITMDILPGDRLLISGPPGCGKTAFFHAINGLWPFCRGTITLPAAARLLFIPQKPFLPIDTLRQALVYPDSADDYDTELIRQTLKDCGLSRLGGRLDEERHWQQELSPGEQQRFAFARAMLLRPQWLFLDETTSALDEASEAALYRLLADTLPQTAVVSIAHRASLIRFHEHWLDFANKAGGYAGGMPQDKLFMNMTY